MKQVLKHLEKIVHLLDTQCASDMVPNSTDHAVEEKKQIWRRRRKSKGEGSEARINLTRIHQRTTIGQENW